MHLAAIPLVAFILSWFGAAGAGSVAAYSVTRVFADGSLATIESYRERALRAVMLATTFIVTGVLSGAASGILHHI